MRLTLLLEVLVAAEEADALAANKQARLDRRGSLQERSAAVVAALVVP